MRLTPLLSLFIAISLLLSAAYAQPALPQVKIDNNRALDGVNCGGYCSGTGYVPPPYEYILGTSAWVGGSAPPGCSFSLPYAATGAGKQSAINAIEACRTLTGAGSILDVPPGNYSTTYGSVIPQTSNTLATQFNVVRSTLWATLAAMPEPVCAGGIQDNVNAPGVTSIGLINPNCDGQNTTALSEPCPSGGALAYQLGTGAFGSTIYCIPAGSFTLANGTATNTSAYNYAQYMYTDICTNVSGAGCTPFNLCSPIAGSANPCSGPGGSCAAGGVAGCIGPDHWLFEDGIATRTAGGTSQNYLVTAGDAPAQATALSQYAFAIDFRRYWAHGDWTTLAAGRNAVINAFFIPTCTQCSIVGSQVSEVLWPGAEGHAVGAGYVGAGTKIDLNWFMGQSSCIFVGGQSNATGPPILPVGSFVPGVDMQIGRNRCTFPYWWLGLTQIPASNTYWGIGGTKPSNIVRKNCEELKDGIRVLFYGFICENTDDSGGQAGISLTFNVRNSSGGVTGQNYQSNIHDVTVQGSIFRHTLEGLSIGARSAGASNGGGVAGPMYNVSFTDVLHYDSTGQNPGGGAGYDRGIRIVSADQHWYGTVTQTDATHATFVATASIDGGATTCTLTGRTNCAPMGELDEGALASLSGSIVTVTVTNQFVNGEDVLFIDPTHSSCLDGQDLTVSSATPTSFTATVKSGWGCHSGGLGTGNVQGPLGYQVLNIFTGAPAPVWGCTNTAFNNVPTYSKGGFVTPSKIAPLATTGSTAWNGNSKPSDYTVTYLWPAGSSNPVGSSDSSGTCQLTNTEGGPAHFGLTHVTYVSDTTNPIGADGTVSGGPGFYTNALFRDSIMLTGSLVPQTKGGWFLSAVGPTAEGTATEQWDTDTSSLTVDHIVWPGRSQVPPIGHLYTEFGNNTSYPDSAGCTGAGCSPPLTMFFPATSCAVGFATSSCGVWISLSLPDYHSYALCHGGTCGAVSPYANAASDGTDIGARVTAIDAYQTMNLYTCSPVPCPGFFPDIISNAPVPQAPAALAPQAFAALDRPKTNNGGNRQ